MVEFAHAWMLASRKVQKDTYGGSEAERVRLNLEVAVEVGAYYALHSMNELHTFSPLSRSLAVRYCAPINARDLLLL